MRKSRKGLGDFRAFCSFWGVKMTGLLVLWLALLSMLIYLIFSWMVLTVDFYSSISSHSLRFRKMISHLLFLVSPIKEIPTSFKLIAKVTFTYSSIS